MEATKAIIIALAVAAGCAKAEIAADYVEGEKSPELITPEIALAAGQMFGDENATKLLHAVRLQMKKYDADMLTGAGRAAWHGRLIGQEIYTNDLCKVSVYSNAIDGTIWRYREPFKPVTVTKMNARLPAPALTNGIPRRLAEARARRSAEKANGATNVTVTVKAVK